MVTAAPPSLEPCEELARLLALTFWKTHYKGEDEPMAHRLASEQWRGQPFLAEAQAMIAAGYVRRAPSAEGRLREALHEVNNLALVIESAVRNTDPQNHLLVLTALKKARAALRGEA